MKSLEVMTDYGRPVILGGDGGPYALNRSRYVICDNEVIMVDLFFLGAICILAVAGLMVLSGLAVLAVTMRWR